MFQLGMGDKYSIIIPTMWRSELIHQMLPLYESCDHVGEVIIIDNDPTRTPDLATYSKIVYHTAGHNIFVNPAWNLGASMAKYRIILANDDILIKDINEILRLTSESDYDIIGLNSRCQHGDPCIAPAPSELIMSYGCFMYVRNFTAIPESMKIWGGDNILFELARKRGMYNGLGIETVRSTTISSDPRQFMKYRQSDARLCKEYIAEMKGKPLINVLIRTSDRPKHFNNMLRSIKSQTYPKYRLHVSADTGFTEQYVRQAGIVPREMEKVYKTRTESFPYNLYFNTLMDDVEDGWVMYMDDDDGYAHEKVFEEIASALQDEDSVYVWRMKFPNGRLIPEDAYWNRLPFRRGHIGGECFAFHSKWRDIARWDANKAGDFRLISRLAERLKVEWIDIVAAHLSNDGANGRALEEITNK